MKLTKFLVVIGLLGIAACTPPDGAVRSNTADDPVFNRGSG